MFIPTEASTTRRDCSLRGSHAWSVHAVNQSHQRRVTKIPTSQISQFGGDQYYQWPRLTRARKSLKIQGVSTRFLLGHSVSSHVFNFPLSVHFHFDPYNKKKPTIIAWKSSSMLPIWIKEFLGKKQNSTTSFLVFDPWALHILLRWSVFSGDLFFSSSACGDFYEDQEIATVNVSRVSIKSEGKQCG